MRQVACHSVEAMSFSVDDARGRLWIHVRWAIVFCEVATEAARAWARSDSQPTRGVPCAWHHERDRAMTHWKRVGRTLQMADYLGLGDSSTDLQHLLMAKRASSHSQRKHALE